MTVFVAAAVAAVDLEGRVLSIWIHALFYQKIFAAGI